MLGRGDAGNPDHPPAAVDHPPAQVSAYAIGDVAYSAQRVGVAENVAAYGRLPWWSIIAGLVLTVLGLIVFYKAP